MKNNRVKLNPDKMDVLAMGPCSELGSGDTVVLDRVAFPSERSGSQLGNAPGPGAAAG